MSCHRQDCLNQEKEENNLQTLFGKNSCNTTKFQSTWLKGKIKKILLGLSVAKVTTDGHFIIDTNLCAWETQHWNLLGYT